MKKIICFLTALVLGASCLVQLAGCTDGGETVPKGENASMEANGWKLEFNYNDEQYTLKAYKQNSTVAEFESEPVTLYVKGKQQSLIGSAKEETCSSGYDKLIKTKQGYTASVTVQTSNGSKIRVTDEYALLNGDFTVNRKVETTKAISSDLGVASAFRLKSTVEDDYEYFTPSILYKDSDYNRSGAVFSNTSIKSMYVMETRTGLPLSMVRNPSNNSAGAVAHIDLDISCNVAGGGENGAVDNGFQYGGIGFEREDDKALACFRYPSAEGPSTYNGTAQGFTKLYHPLKTDVSNKYSFALLFSSEETYTQAMTDIFKRAYLLEDPDVATDVNVDSVWNDNIYMFNSTYKEFGTGSFKSAGIPWSMDLVDEDKYTPYSFQMGFVGQQTSVGASLMREGYNSNSDALLKKGKTILDFWTSSSVYPANRALPMVWWDPADNSQGGNARGYNYFLRAFVDGAEGVLDGYIISRENNEENSAYKSFVTRIADFLCKYQNSDGSFYRAYNLDGTPDTSADECVQGSSKFNTPNAVRFLSRMYELTGEQKYLTAAKSAADYAYDNLYNGIMKYVGGTIDNPNVCDREASIYALYCFESIYSVTGEAKYLQAAEHAAASALSWVYCYDFCVYNDSENQAYNPFRNGGTSGFSFIGTGGSGADNFASYLYYVFFRMYIHTGDTFYFKAARLLQYNTKQSSDYTGELGYAYKAIATEATQVANFSYYSVNAWLPWSSIANIDPISKMNDTFGVSSVDSVTQDIDSLKQLLKTEGICGQL